MKQESEGAAGLLQAKRLQQFHPHDAKVQDDKENAFYLLLCSDGTVRECAQCSCLRVQVA